MRVQMVEVQSWDDLHTGGHYLMANRSGIDPLRPTHGDRFPIVCCPCCERPGACSAHTLVQEKPLTIRASFLCGQSKEGGSCGCHGFITDGVFESC